MSGVRVEMIADVPVRDYGHGSTADVEAIAVYLISGTGSGQEPVYTRVKKSSAYRRFMRVSFTAEPDKLLLMMARLSALWERWDDKESKLLPAIP